MAQKKKNKKNLPSRAPLTRRQFRELLHGPNTANLKARTTPKQFKRLKKRARRLGYANIESFLSGTPAALAPKPPRALQRDALKMVNAVFKPAIRELTQQEKRVRAIDEKRADDHKYYLDWLNDRQSQAMTQARVADQELLANLDRTQQGLQQSYDDANAQLQAQAASHVGTVSDFSKANADELNVQQATTAQKSAALTKLIDKSAALGTAGAKTVAANNFAILAAQEAKRVGDTWAALKDLGDAKQKVKLEKAAAAAKEVARLMDSEIGKAESNRDYQAVLAKLKLDQSELAETIRYHDLQDENADAQTALGRARLEFDQWKANEDFKFDQADLELDWFKARSTDKHYRRQDKKGYGAGKEWDPFDSSQRSFDLAYNNLVKATRNKNVRNEFSGEIDSVVVPVSPKYVRRFENKILAGLMTELGVNKKIARSAIRAYLSSGGSKHDPGNWRRWLPGHTERLAD